MSTFEISLSHKPHPTYLPIWIGCLYLIVILLMALLSTHILIFPSFLGTNKASTAQGLKLSLTIPLASDSSTCLCISWCLWASFCGL